MATHSSILAWRTPWSLVDYSPRGHKELYTTEPLNTHTCMHANMHVYIYMRGSMVYLIGAEK